MEEVTESTRFYNSIAAGYDELYMTEQLNKLTEIIAVLGDDIPKKKEKLLDIGCGTGISTAVWNCDCTGIDPSAELIECAKKKYPKHKFVVGSAEKLPFPDQSFDIVVSVTSIHNFSDIRKCIDEMKRVGKDRFIISILRKSKNVEDIQKLIIINFRIKRVVMEEKDLIFICSKREFKRSLQSL